MSFATDNLARTIETILKDFSLGLFKIVIIDDGDGEKSIEVERVKR